MRLKNASDINSHGNIEGRRIVSELLEIGLNAADPASNTEKLLRREGNLLYVGDELFDPVASPRTGVEVYDLDKDIDRVFIFGVGKGIWQAIEKMEEILGEYLFGGNVILKYGDQAVSSKLDITFAAHPVPDENCIYGCKKMLNAISEAKLTARDLVFTVIGNGVSSLLTLPPEELTLEDVKNCTQVIQIERGLSTPQLNLVRNQLDILKSGRITRMLYPAKMIHIVAIDVNCKNRYNLAGYEALMETNTWLHTLPDMTTPETAVDFLKKNDLWDSMTPRVRNYLLEHAAKYPVLTRKEFEAMDCRIFGLMPKALSASTVMMDRARELGYEPHLLTREIFQEATVASGIFCNIARLVDDEGTPFKAPCALIARGELLVTVGKNGGIGGRNQEFCLAAAQYIKGNPRIVVGAVDTDGSDGPGGSFCSEADEAGCTCLSGGLVDGYTVSAAEKLGVDIGEALRSHATSQALWKLKCGVWATQNISINDLIVLLVMEKGCET